MPPLIPLQILWRDPVGLNSVDSPGACRCDDGCDYVVKDGAKDRHTPHNEWFCSSLAESIGIPGPPYGVIEEAPGAFVFGSRWEGGVTKENWWEMVARGDIALDEIKPALSKIFAFDHFVLNDDRHLANFLVREQRNGWAVLAFDYSRAWLYGGFPPHSLPFSPHAKTLLASRVLKSVVGDYILLPYVDETVDRLRAVSDLTIENIMRRQPDSWLTPVEQQLILQWWRSQDRITRLEAIRKGIRDGTYL